MSDEHLDRSLDAMADAADGEALRTGQRPTPPFAAVMARAHRIDPARVPGGAVAQAGRVGAPRPTPDPDAMLDRLVDAARVCADAAVHAQSQRPTPPLRRVAPKRRRVAGMVAAGGLFAAAAAVVAVVSLRGSAFDRDVAEPDAKVLAAAQAAAGETGGVAVVPSPREQPRRAPVTPRAPIVPAAPLERIEGSPPDPAVVPGSATPDLDPTHDPATESPPPATPRRRAVASRPSLAELDARAQTALADGALERAEAALTELTRRGGRTRLAEAAFGDLFALAHRRHGAAAQRKLWRAYLRRFEHGRFADDARAGLCRRAAGDATTCWRRYLDDFASGAYRSQAERALAASEPSNEP